MWVVLHPSLVADGAFPEVRVGHTAAAALVLEQPVPSAESSRPVDGAGTITPAPDTQGEAISPRYRVTGVTTLHGKRLGVEAAGMFVLLDETPPPPGRPFDAVGDLYLTTWLVPRSARSDWSVRGIILHTAPVPVLAQAAAPAAASSSGARLMTPQQYIDAAGAEAAQARGAWVRGGPPDFTIGEQRNVEQVTVLGRDPIGTARRYLLNVELASAS